MLKTLSRRRLLSLSLPAILASNICTSSPSSTGQSSTSKMANASASASPSASSWPVQAYTPRHQTWPYSDSDFTRMDSSPDTDFYSAPRFVNHIDDNAVSVLRQYYDQELPRRGKILELCSSWVSHFPESLKAEAKVHIDNGAKIDSETRPEASETRGLAVTGYGMNFDELRMNQVLARRVLKDLNADPEMEAVDRDATVDAATCVVSIDYLVKPRAVLESVLEALRPGARVHLVISNRCFPTKVIGRWLNVGEEERLQMVGDYFWFAGFRDVEIVMLESGKDAAWFRSKDPLWVVRASKPQSIDS